jgi:hypothetical protein
MKRRIRRIANFFAFNLLFFALYLNFIHKDKAGSIISEQGRVQATAAVTGTVPVNQPEKYLHKASASPETGEDANKAANLSVN